jgi:hypothetical protein
VNIPSWYGAYAQRQLYFFEISSHSLVVKPFSHALITLFCIQVVCTLTSIQSKLSFINEQLSLGKEQRHVLPAKTSYKNVAFSCNRLLQLLQPVLDVIFSLFLLCCFGNLCMFS